jgi:hypothetical protein
MKSLQNCSSLPKSLHVEKNFAAETDRQTERIERERERERERRTHTHLVWEVSFEAFRADFCIGKDFDQ